MCLQFLAFVVINKQGKDFKKKAVTINHQNDLIHVCYRNILIIINS